MPPSRTGAGTCIASLFLSLRRPRLALGRSSDDHTALRQVRFISKIGFERWFFTHYRDFEFDGQRPFASILEHKGCALMEWHVAEAP